MTYLEKLKIDFPDAWKRYMNIRCPDLVYKNGRPNTIYYCLQDKSCQECWNQEYKEK